MNPWRGRSFGPVGRSSSHELSRDIPTLSESGILRCALGKVALGGLPTIYASQKRGNLIDFKFF